MIIEEERKRRRFTYRLVQLGLLVLSVGILGALWGNRRGDRFDPDPEVRVGRATRASRAARAGSGDMTFSTTVPTAAQLAPGDMQLSNAERHVELILHGPHIYAGLSPEMVERVRTEIRNAGPDDSSGLGGFIASTVKQTVADKIGLHVRYDVADIRDIRLEGDRLVIEWKSGKDQQLFESVKTDRGRGEANHFRPEEAQRFIELVKERQRQIEDGSYVIIQPTKP